jgi:hypothetical protein
MKNLMRTQLTLITPKCKPGATNPHSPQQRLLLYPQELYRIPATYGKVRVVAGMALLTQAGRDEILHPGHEASINAGGDVALVSALHSRQLVLELY